MTQLAAKPTSSVPFAGSTRPPAPAARWLLRVIATICGIAAFAGLFIPDACFFGIADPRLANPLALQIGIWILKSCLAIEGSLCLLLAKSNYRYVSIDAAARALPDPDAACSVEDPHPGRPLLEPQSARSSSVAAARSPLGPGTAQGAEHQVSTVNQPDLSGPAALLCLAAITTLAAVLRLWQVNNGLWLDELTPLLAYRNNSLLQLLSVYLSTNNHLLYTVLEKWLTGVFGETEWVVRLPAVLLGIATVPLSYLVGRLVMNRYSSLAAAMIVATSFHLVFFSQNARGYSPFLFFSLCATIFFVRALQRDRARDWVCYALSMVLDVAFLLGPSIAVFLSHVAIGAVALAKIAKRGQPARPLLRRLSAVLAVTCLLMLHLYSLIFPQALFVLQSTYSQPSTGFSLFSSAFLAETVRGLSAGFSGVLLIAALPALIVLGAGCKSLWRTNWALVSALLLPQILLAVFMGVLKLAVSPRFFILALPAAILIGGRGLDIVCSFVCAALGRPRLARIAFVLAVLVLLVGTAPSLVRYYAIPKQDFRSAVQYMQEVRLPGQILVPIYTARGGFAYYANRDGLHSGVDYLEAKEPQDFAAVLAAHPPEQLLIMTTFSRALHMDHPEMEQQIVKNWQVAKVFPGTIGDGAVTVWVPKNRACSR